MEIDQMGPKPANKAYIRECAPTERRRSDLMRTEVAIRGRLLREDLPELDVTIRNLSAAGFMAECLVPLEPGTAVVLALPGVGYIPAEIRWNVSFRAGALFQFELSARELGLIGH